MLYTYKTTISESTKTICQVELVPHFQQRAIMIYSMKWLRYQRVIILKIQVGNTNQRNKWVNTDPWIYRRWDQVSRRSKHPLLIDHTRREPSSMIMNTELSAVKVSVSSTF